MSLRLYNTLTQTLEPFRTITPNRVLMYVCGPTVYSASHVGHMVGPVLFDTFKKYLEYLGYSVKWIVNITDIDDKLIDQAIKENTTVQALAERVTKDYLECLDGLGVTGIDEMPRATEHVPQILAMIQGLIEKGFAYPSGGDVYFDVTKKADYGKLSHRDPEELLAGARIELSSLKKHPGDFALWKGSKPGEPAWESPWGPGRPGWHIECSAMCQSLLGDQLDVHGGGLDLVFPHHENEVAQSEAFTEKPFASFWMHNGLVTTSGRKISKSDPGTLVIMRDLLHAHDRDTLRAMYLMGHYRRPTEFGHDRLTEITRGLQAFHTFFDRFQRVTGQPFHHLNAPTQRQPLPPVNGDSLQAELRIPRNQFLDAMDEDFNTGGAFGALFDVLRPLNRFIDLNKLESPDRDPAKVEELVQGTLILRELSQVLGMFLKPLIRAQSENNALTGSLLDFLVELRTSLRKAKQFQLADEIRNRLKTLNVTLEDRPDGTGWKID